MEGLYPLLGKVLLPLVEGWIMDVSDPAPLADTWPVEDEEVPRGESSEPRDEQHDRQDNPDRDDERDADKDKSDKKDDTEGGKKSPEVKQDEEQRERSTRRQGQYISPFSPMQPTTP